MTAEDVKPGQQYHSTDENQPHQKHEERMSNDPKRLKRPWALVFTVYASVCVHLRTTSLPWSSSCPFLGVLFDVGTTDAGKLDVFSFHRKPRRKRVPLFAIEMNSPRSELQNCCTTLAVVYAVRATRTVPTCHDVSFVIHILY